MDLIQAALLEDMPQGDITTEGLGLGPRPGTARLLAKQNVVLSGTQQFEQTMKRLDSSLFIGWNFHDGDLATKGQTICTLRGDLIQILKAERVALNFIGHLSGIATLTRQFVEQVAQTKTKIIDTRKTLPAYRELEKRAVKHGGGFNHRLNLSDAILVKDNHIAVAGGIAAAVTRLRRYTRKPIELEVSNLNQVREAVQAKVERILLDNMSNEEIREALALIPPEVSVEASGNMKLERVAQVAELGVDFISVGALTHSAPNADLSLLFDWSPAAE